MKIPFFRLSMILALLAAPAIGGELHPERLSHDVFRGAQMHLTFSNLEPNHRYLITLSPTASGFGFTGSVLNPPEHVHITNTEIDFTSPASPDPGSHLATEKFTVGVFLPKDASIHSNLESPASLTVEFDSPHSLSPNKLHSDKTAEKSAAFSMSGAGGTPLNSGTTPVGCNGQLCSLDIGCTKTTPIPVKCYGPYIGTFYCCRADPFP